MGKVSLESSNKLSALGDRICGVKNEMQDNLKLLNEAFLTACDSWKDRNAQTCESALNDHNTAMRSVFSRLSDIENAVARLSDLAADYEEI